MVDHVHDPATKRPLHDARGIFCGYMCDQCEVEKRREFRVEIFTNPNYATTELVESDFPF